MRSLIFTALLVAACTPPSPVPPPSPDASDASPGPTSLDGAPTPPAAACELACVQLGAFCGPQVASCPSTMRNIQTDRLIRGEAGQPLTCACVAGARSRAAILACGAACGGGT